MTPFDLWNATGCKPERADIFAKPLQDAVDKWAIKRVAFFVAQVAHESALFTRLEENLNYSAQGLANTWSRFSSTLTRGGPPNELALSIARKPEAIANEVYSNRMGNGPPESGDGWLYRGRGLKQLTGKQNYTRYQQATGIEVILHPDLLLEPRFAADSAGWFWTDNNLDGYDDVRRVSRIINGGDIGIEARIALTERASSVFS